MNLVLDTTADVISGTVASASGGWTANVTNYLAATLAPVNQGTYLVVVPGPAAGPIGDSILSANISSAGVATLTGYLADGTAVSTTNQLSALGNCPIYIPLYGGGQHGMLFGWLTFTNDLGNPPVQNNVTAPSSLTWENSASPTAGGFTNQTVPVASFYNGAQPALTGLNFYAVLTGGCFGSSFVTNAVTVVSNTITVDPHGTNQLSLTLNNGTITGRFTDRGTNNYIGGLVLQNTNDAFGYFTNTGGTQMGSFALLNTYVFPATNGYPRVIGLTNFTLLESPTPTPVTVPLTLFDPSATAGFSFPVAAAADPNFFTVAAHATGTSGTFTITPIANTFTNAMVVTLIASDGTLSSTTTVTATTLFVNQAPTFALLGEVDVTNYDAAVKLCIKRTTLPSAAATPVAPINSSPTSAQRTQACSWSNPKLTPTAPSPLRPVMWGNRNRVCICDK